MQVVKRVIAREYVAQQSPSTPLALATHRGPNSSKKWCIVAGIVGFVVVAVLFLAQSSGGSVEDAIALTGRGTGGILPAPQGTITRSGAQSIFDQTEEDELELPRTRATVFPPPLPVSIERRPLGKVENLAELRDFCSVNAPQLDKASWKVENITHLTVKTRMGHITHYVEDVPTCVDEFGRVMVDHVKYDAGLSVLDRFLKNRYTVHPLTDDSFQFAGQQRHTVAIPAVGLIARGKWIDTHIWHLIRDCLGVLLVLFNGYNYGELFTVPTQTLLLRNETESWVDRYGDTKKKMELSAKALNSFSSPRLGGPFFETSPTIIARAPDSSSTQAQEEQRTQPQMYCFCQSIGIRTRILKRNVDGTLFTGIQDMIARRFDEDDYLTGYSFEETDRRRRASHPWASQFWNESTFDVNGTYRPRALVIHRKTRLIGDVEKYVDHLRKLNFRVEEIFPERLPLEQQYHLGRYADLLVGMHGLGVAHAFWMDRFPIGCRAVVEFRPWVTPGLPVDLHRILGRFIGFDYHYPEPIDVTFSDNVKDHTLARTRLMDNAHLHSAFAFPEFTDQTAYYNEVTVTKTFDKVKNHLDRCLLLNERVPRFSVVMGNAPKTVL